MKRHEPAIGAFSDILGAALRLRRNYTPNQVDAALAAIRRVDKDGAFDWLLAKLTTSPEHRCGVSGFAESGDTCPGCVFNGRVRL